MGQPPPLKTGGPSPEHIGRWDDNPANWNILVAGGKEKNIYSPSSGERKGRSPNFIDRAFETGLPAENAEGSRAICL
jgi:hypothetical protein